MGMVVCNFYSWVLESLSWTPSHGCPNDHLAKYCTFSGASTCNPVPVLATSYSQSLSLKLTHPDLQITCVIFLNFFSLLMDLDFGVLPCTGLRNLSDNENYPDLLGMYFPQLPNNCALGFWHWTRMITISTFAHQNLSPTWLFRLDEASVQISSLLPFPIIPSDLHYSFFKTRAPRISHSRTVPALTLYFSHNSWKEGIRKSNFSLNYT